MQVQGVFQVEGCFGVSIDDQDFELFEYFQGIDQLFDVWVEVLLVVVVVVVFLLLLEIYFWIQVWVFVGW